MADKWALVDGAKGHTGSFLVKHLLAKGYKVVATDLPPRERKDLMTKETVFKQFEYMDVEKMGNPGDVTFIPTDLTQKESLKVLFSEKAANGGQYSVIFHPASLYDYFAELDILRKINVGGLTNFLEVISEHYEKTKLPTPHLIHWSTCGVYGQPVYQRTKDGYAIPADETAPFDPPNNYSVSKKEQEELLNEYCPKHNIPYTIIRSAPIYGPYQTYGAFHIYYMVKKLGWMPLPCLRPLRDSLMMPMVHVEDLVEAAIFLANNPKAYNQVYNCIGDSTTQEEWMAFMFEELGIQYLVVPIGFKLYSIAAGAVYWWVEKQVRKAKKLGVRPKIDLPMADYITHNYYFSNAKLKSLGFQFKYGDPRSGTRQTIRWYLDHGWFDTEDLGVQEKLFAEKAKEPADPNAKHDTHHKPAPLKAGVKEV